MKKNTMGFGALFFAFVAVFAACTAPTTNTEDAATSTVVSSVGVPQVGTIAEESTANRAEPTVIDTVESTTEVMTTSTTIQATGAAVITTRTTPPSTATKNTESTTTETTEAMECAALDAATATETWTEPEDWEAYHESLEEIYASRFGVDIYFRHSGRDDLNNGLFINTVRFTQDKYIDDYGKEQFYVDIIYPQVTGFADPKHEKNFNNTIRKFYLDKSGNMKLVMDGLGKYGKRRTGEMAYEVAGDVLSLLSVQLFADSTMPIIHVRSLNINLYSGKVYSNNEILRNKTFDKSKLVTEANAKFLDSGRHSDGTANDALMVFPNGLRVFSDKDGFLSPSKYSPTFFADYTFDELAGCLDTNSALYKAIRGFN